MLDNRDLGFILGFAKKASALKADIKNALLRASRMFRLSRRLRGFMLIEMMIAIFIFLLIAAVMFTILATGRNAWQIGDAQILLQQELRKAMDGIVEELRQSGPTRIDIPAVVGEPYNEVTFQIPEDVTFGYVVWGEEIQYLLGGLNGRQLLRRSGGEERVLANDIISLEFSRQPTSPDIVDVALEVDKETIRGTRIDNNLNFQVKLRN